MMDIVGATVLLVLLAPLFVVVTALVKVSSPGAVFFRQQRHGAAGQLFTMLKFRTMRADTNSNHHKQYVTRLANSGEPLSKIDAQHDYIPLGRFWRATGIDELPQLLNVLRGEMSLVGPRPDVLAIEDYQPWQLRRFEVTPGLTGLWQVTGKNQTTFEQMIKLDIRYVDCRSFRMDLMILLRTIPAVIRYALA